MKCWGVEVLSVEVFGLVYKVKYYEGLYLLGNVIINLGT